MLKVVSRRGFARLWFALGALLFVAMQANTQAQAQTYPTQPLRIVIGYAAGGTTDI
jgi:tripartite-type tricarboxylate transporter receptor subunit TctC